MKARLRGAGSVALAGVAALIWLRVVGILLVVLLGVVFGLAGRSP